MSSLTLSSSSSSSSHRSGTHAFGRQIQTNIELDSIKSRIRQAFLKLQSVEATSLQFGSPLYLGTTPEQNLVNVVHHLHHPKPFVHSPLAYHLTYRNEEDEQLRSNSYADLIESLSAELKTKYPSVEETELALILIELLLPRDMSERIMITNVWAEVFKTPKPRWDQEIGKTALSVVNHLLRVCFAKEKHAATRDFGLVINFLKVLNKSISKEYHDEWVFNCIEEICQLSVDQRSEFELALDATVEGQRGDILAKLQEGLKEPEKDRRTKHLLEKLNGNKIDSHDAHTLDEVIEELGKGECGNSEVWHIALKKIISVKGDALKLKAWKFWFKHYQTFAGQEFYEMAWHRAVSLLQVEKPSVAAELFCSPAFVEILRLFSEKQPLLLSSFYETVLKYAVRHSNSCSQILDHHQNYMTAHSCLNNDQIFELVMRAINASQKNSKSRDGLIKQFVQEENADSKTMNAIHRWLMSRAKEGPWNEEDTKEFCGLALAVLKSLDAYHGTLNCLELANIILGSKMRGANDLALRFAFKAFTITTKDKFIGAKEKSQKLDECFNFMGALIQNATDNEMASYFNDAKTLISLFYEMEMGKWQSSKGVNFVGAVAQRCSTFKGNQADSITFLCTMWELIRRSNNATIINNFMERLIDMTLAIVPVPADGVDESYFEAFQKACRCLKAAFSGEISIKMDKGGASSRVKRSVDVLIERLCVIAKSNRPILRLLIPEVINIIRDPRNLKTSILNGSAKTLLTICFDHITPTLTGVTLTEETIEAVLAFVYDKDMRPVLTDFLVSLKDENQMFLSVIMVLHQYCHLLIKQAVDNNDITERLNRIDRDMRLMIDVDIFTLEAKRHIWLNHFNFLINNLETLGAEQRTRFIIILLNLVEVMVNKGIKPKSSKTSTSESECEITLEYLDEVLKMCDEGIPLLLNAYRDIAPMNVVVRRDILDALLRMCEMKTNFRLRSNDDKWALIQQLIDLAIANELELRHLDWIIALAKKSQIEHPNFLASQDSKSIVRVVSDQRLIIYQPEGHYQERRQSGVERLFDAVLSSYSQDKSINTLVLASKLLKVCSFEDFKNDQSCGLMISIFNKVINASLNHENRTEIIKSEFFRNLFRALTTCRQKSIGDFRPLKSNLLQYETLKNISDFIGSKNVERMTEAAVMTRAALTNMFTIYSLALEDTVNFPDEAQNVCLKLMKETVETFSLLKYLPSVAQESCAFALQVLMKLNKV